MSIVTKLAQGKYIFVFDYFNGKKTGRKHCKATRRVRRDKKTHFSKI